MASPPHCVKCCTIPVMWCVKLDNAYDDSSRLSPQTHLTLQDVRLPCAHLRSLCGRRYWWSHTRHRALFGSNLWQISVRRTFQTPPTRESESWPCASSSRRNISCTHSSLPHAPNNMPHKSRTLWTTSIEHKLSIILHHFPFKRCRMLQSHTLVSWRTSHCVWIGTLHWFAAISYLPNYPLTNIQHRWTGRRGSSTANSSPLHAASRQGRIWLK